MAVQQKVFPWIRTVARDNGRLDQTYFTNRCGDLSVFWSFLDRVGHELKGLDVGNSNAQLDFLKRHFH
jgi:hypothetical protein